MVSCSQFVFSTTHNESAICNICTGRQITLSGKKSLTRDSRFHPDVSFSSPSECWAAHDLAIVLAIICQWASS